MHTSFIAEVSSNHHRDLNRCLQFIETSAHAGCDAVKFQLFKIEKLFASEILAKSETHRNRKQWELPLSFLPALKKKSDECKIQFSCTPFYLEAVTELQPYVDFYKIASYELLWDDLLIRCAETEIPVVLSTGMASFEEIDHAVDVLKTHKVSDLTLLHCVSAYPSPENESNLAVLEEFRKRYGVKVGWSDHSVSAAVIQRAVHRWQADAIEFHLDLDGEGEEFGAGHCWLPNQIQNVISDARKASQIDGKALKLQSLTETPDRDWRADPSDGLRPLLHLRKDYRA